jgi:hypothetical protein
MAARQISRWIATTAAAGVLVVAASSPAQAAPTVRALWHMDAVPTMVDSVGGDNNGKTVGIAMRDGYYAFDGTTSIASVPHKANLNPGTANMKIEVKVNATTAPAAGETFDLIRKGTSATVGGYYKIELKTTSTGAVNAACIFKDKNKLTGMAVGRVPATGWLTISCARARTATATTVTLAVNGTTTRTTTTAKPIGAISNTSGVFVGGKGDGTDVFSGLADMASITIG